jgi:hypothetical protein
MNIDGGVMARLGLFFIRVVVWATEQLSRPKAGFRDYVLAGAAHAAMAGVTIAGALIDRVTGVAASRSIATNDARASLATAR